jgi:hypothetical protein
MCRYTIEFDERDTAPDKIEQVAALHGISPETLIARFISAGLELHFPITLKISDFDTLDEFMIGAGFLKPKKAPP